LMPSMGYGQAADGLRARYAPSSGGLYYLFQWDPQGSLVQRQTGGAGGNTSYYALDTAMFDGYGAKLGDTDAFTGNPEPTRDAMGFQGQFGAYTDTETGLVLMGHRYYDAGTGRFLTRDPLGYGGGINLYGFTGNNPVNDMDPDGTQSDNSDPGDATANQLSMRGRIQIFKAQPQFKPGSQQRRDYSNFLSLTPLGGAMAVHQAATGHDAVAGTRLSLLQRVTAFGAAALAMMGVHANREEGSATGQALHSFSIEEQEGNLIITNAVTPHGAVRFVAEHIREGDTLVLKGFDIEGPGAAKMGREGLNAFAQAYGRSQGVKRLIIEGARRSTGRNIGRIPKPAVFEIK
jgi:RHS repeat-associated protein